MKYLAIFMVFFVGYFAWEAIKNRRYLATHPNLPREMWVSIPVRCIDSFIMAVALTYIAFCIIG